MRRSFTKNLWVLFIHPIYSKRITLSKHLLNYINSYTRRWITYGGSYLGRCIGGNRGEGDVFDLCDSVPFGGPETLQAPPIDPLHHTSSCALPASGKYLKEVGQPSAQHILSTTSKMHKARHRRTWIPRTPHLERPVRAWQQVECPRLGGIARVLSIVV